MVNQDSDNFGSQKYSYPDGNQKNEIIQNQPPVSEVVTSQKNWINGMKSILNDMEALNQKKNAAIDTQSIVDAEVKQLLDALALKQAEQERIKTDILAIEGMWAEMKEKLTNQMCEG